MAQHQPRGLLVFGEFERGDILGDPSHPSPTTTLNGGAARRYVHDVTSRRTPSRWRRPRTVSTVVEPSAAVKVRRTPSQGNGLIPVALRRFSLKHGTGTRFNNRNRDIPPVGHEDARHPDLPADDVFHHTVSLSIALEIQATHPGVCMCAPAANTKTEAAGSATQRRYQACGRMSIATYATFFHAQERRPARLL